MSVLYRKCAFAVRSRPGHEQLVGIPRCVRSGPRAPHDGPTTGRCRPAALPALRSGTCFIPRA